MTQFNKNGVILSGETNESSYYNIANYDDFYAYTPSTGTNSCTENIRFLGLVKNKSYYVAVLLTLGKIAINKLSEIWGIETKANLYKKAQEERIAELEKAVKDLNEELDDKQNSLYKKQKGYHEQSIQIRNELKDNQVHLSDQISDLSVMMQNFITDQNNKTVASFRSSLWRMHKDFTNQGYVTPDGLKTFIEMGKLYEASGGDDIYHEKLLPEVEALDIHYPDGSIYSQK